MDRLNLVSLFVVLPTFVIMIGSFFVFNYAFGSLFNFYQNSNIEYTLQFRSDQSKLISAIIGQGTLDNSQIESQLEIYDSLGGLLNFSWYVNPLIQVFIIILVIIAIAQSIYTYQKKTSIQHIFYLITLCFIPISLLLSFGRSLGLELLNKVFLILPFVDFFGSSHNFYSLFLAALVIFIVIQSEYYNDLVNSFKYIVVSFVILSSILVWLNLSAVSII